MEHKICTTCWENKPISQFKLIRVKYIVNECNSCKAAYQLIYQAEYKIKNKELISQKAKDKRLNNRALGITKDYSERKTKENTHTCAIKGCYEEKTESSCRLISFQVFNKMLKEKGKKYSKRKLEL